MAAGAFGHASKYGRDGIFAFLHKISSSVTYLSLFLCFWHLQTCHPVQLPPDPTPAPSVLSWHLQTEKHTRSQQVRLLLFFFFNCVLYDAVIIMSGSVIYLILARLSHLINSNNGFCSFAFIYIRRDKNVTFETDLTDSCHSFRMFMSMDPQPTTGCPDYSENQTTSSSWIMRDSPGC